ncbi:Phytanoyl-CoA dioxygenase (PhyH) [uncultured archaeon]|nr:Phytanoyl-CoA dioxygenase (PhyH) [uncultured archaeon]
MSKHQFYWKANPHQDWYTIRGSLDAITAWTPIAPLTKDMGYLEVVPGSHKNGLLKHKDFGNNYEIIESTDSLNWKPIEMDIGDVLFFSTFTIHRSGYNKSDKIRWTEVIRYDNALEPSFVAREFPLNFKSERVDKKLIDCFLYTKELNALFT